ncbi:ABC transporter permease subunit [Verrucomicrobia bacterium]|jgi:oligopeptide transport system permease protein|nr:ABC transporter permease subunit [Verrucomicrobiota bacterium]MDB4626150.1 ABC transporter permease subunit [bacterium]MBT5062298.1 ABC transporter permease subunit [Verrucomicrobiota bacterium]MBT5479074.1 ABC transporter permease subunit [Verrucomicrobiota bacterium]MBT6239261.1 ABC transporter permease subunit [Verrucomicrobiota bacterium]
MIRFILRRILQTIPVLWAVATLTFFMLRLAPGGPFADERAVSPEVQKALEAHYGLDKPLIAQYGEYLFNLIQGDLGPSFKYPGRTVNEIIQIKFPKSMELGIYSMSIALVFGLTLGVIASLKPNSFLDYVPSSLSMVGICLPTFVLGPLLVLVFALKLKWFPYPGWDGPAYKVLPSATLGFFYAAYIARLTRGGMREVLTQDYIRTARAKGAAAHTVILRHALRGGILPVVSFMGPAFAGLVAGSFVIETIFNIPGLGKDFVTSAFNRDYTMVLGLVVFFAALIVVFNTIVDVVQVWLNPKLKLE